VPWLILVQVESLPGLRPYRKIWLAGMVFWLLAVHWIRLPHPLNYLAWFALTVYLGLYLSAFVFLGRFGVHQWRIPLVIIAPVVWTGLEGIRAHLFTGFLMASLAHTQYRVPTMIQVADIAGEYGVTFLIMFVAASVTQLLGALGKPNTAFSLKNTLLITAPTASVLMMAWAYGRLQLLDQALQDKAPPGPRIALIQGNTPADWKMDQERQEEIMREYIGLSERAVHEANAKDGRQPDLVVWPETAFRQTLVEVQAGYTPPADRVHKSVLTAAKADLAGLVERLGCAVLVGIDRFMIMPGDGGEMKYEGFNSAVLVNRSGEIVATYDKMHRVPFGEFIPLANWFPFLYNLTPLTGGIVAGERATVMELADGTQLSPNICYETVVPHLIRRQWNDFFAKAGRPPDALINITNDGWFWGSSELDMHLACGVFRALETRTQLLIAANGGLSAWVDPAGRIRQSSPRQQTATLLVDLEKRRSGGSFYMMHGDWFAITCMVCCVILAIAAVRLGWRHSSATST
jgi:apolipoprotein N-acyltransferase